MKNLSKILSIAIIGFLFSCSGDIPDPNSVEIDGKLKMRKLEGANIAISNAVSDQLNPHVIFLPDKNLWFAVWEDYTSSQVTQTIGTGDASTVTFTATLSNTPIVPGSVTVTDSTETFSDGGLGILTSPAGGTGTINYTTGAISVTFFATPALAAVISATYSSYSMASGADIKGRFITSTGTLCGSEITVVSATGNHTLPWAAYRNTAGGKIVVVWQDTRGTASSGYVYYQTINVSSLNTSTCAGSSLGTATAIGFNGTKEHHANVVITPPIPSSANIGTGDAVITTFTATLTTPVVPDSVTVTAGGVTLTDNGAGGFTGAGSGTINYATGALSVTFTVAPATGVIVVVAYNYNPPKTTANIGLGDGTAKVFGATLTVPVVPGSVEVTDGTNTLTDNSAGGFTGLGFGTINYNSGVLSVTFNTAPAIGDTVSVDYLYYSYSGTPTIEDVGDSLVARRAPRIIYDSIRDRFWAFWTETRSIRNMASELCFGGAAFTWYFGDTSFPAYVELNGSDLTELANGIDVTGADLIRNADAGIAPTRTNRLITSARAALTETYEYEYFTNINGMAASSDTTAALEFTVWGGIRWKGVMTCTCNDDNGNDACDTGESVTSTFSSSANPGDGSEHIYGLFDQEILEAEYSKQLDSSSTPSYYPAVQYDSASHQFLTAWEDTRNGSNTKIYGQIVLPTGSLYNSNSLITYQDTNNDGSQDSNVANSKQTKPFISFDSVNQRCFVIWQDGRNGSVSLENLDIYGQYVNADGSPSGTNYSITIAPANQYYPTLAYNSTVNQFLAVWKDARNYSTTASDIYGQRFSVGMPQLTLLNTDNSPLSPLLLDFGTATVGQTITKSFKIRNSGDVNLKIDCFTTPAPSGSTFSHQSLDAALQTCQGTYASGTYVELVPGGELPYTVEFHPADVGTFIASFGIQSDAENKTINLQGVGVGMTVSPSALAFPDTAEGLYSDLTVTVTNNGTTSFQITSISGATAPFSIPSPLTVPYTLDTGQTVTFTVRFSPTGLLTNPQNFSAQLDILTSITGLSKSLAISGNGVTSPLTIDPASLAFGSLPANTSATSTITLTASGSDVTLDSFAISGAGFQLVAPPPPGTVIAAGNSDTVDVKFSPTDTGNYSGTLTINTDAGTSTVPLSGSGTGSKIFVSPTSLDFGAVRTNYDKNLSVTVTNNGNLDLVISGITTPSSGAFTHTGVAGTVAAGETYSFVVTFAPTTEGSFSSSFTIESDALNGDQTITVEGQGVNPSVLIDPSPVNFNNTQVGTTSSMNVNITNTGTADITINAFDAPASPFSFVSAPAAGTTLTPGETRQYVIRFSPTSEDTFTSSFSVLFDFDTTTPVPINVTGTGTATAVGGSLTFEQPAGTTVTSIYMGKKLINTSNTLTVRIANSDVVNDINITDVAVSDPAFVPALSAPFSVAASGNQDFQVTFTPTNEQSYSGTLTLTDDANATYQLSLTGTGSTVEVVIASMLPVPPGTVAYYGSLTSSQLPTAYLTSGTVSKAVDFVVDNTGTGFTTTVDVTFDSLPGATNRQFYTIVGNTWTLLTPTSVTGNTVRFSITDTNDLSLGDADTTDGKIRCTLVVVTTGSGPAPGPGAVTNTGGCFIATAAYGSYLDPHVMALREFRDKRLLTNAAGRLFVKTYYRLSPPVADFIRRHEPLRVVTRLALTPIVYGVQYPLLAVVIILLAAGGRMAYRYSLRPRSIVSRSS